MFQWRFISSPHLSVSTWSHLSTLFYWLKHPFLWFRIKKNKINDCGCLCIAQLHVLSPVLSFLSNSLLAVVLVQSNAAIGLSNLEKNPKQNKPQTPPNIPMTACFCIFAFSLCTCQIIRHIPCSGRMLLLIHGFLIYCLILVQLGLTQLECTDKAPGVMGKCR